MGHRYTLLLSIAIVVSLTNISDAAWTYYGVPAAACVPDTETLNNNRYEVNSDASIGNPTSTFARFHCTISVSHFSAIWGLRLTAAGTQSNPVTAAVVKWDKSTGQLSGLGYVPLNTVPVTHAVVADGPLNVYAAAWGESYDPVNLSYVLIVDVNPGATFYGVGLMGDTTASRGDYGAVAGTCQPDVTTINSARHLVSNGGNVTFKGSATGTITLYCPVAAEFGNVIGNANFRITYKNNTSSGFVRATLKKMNRSSGSSTTLATRSSQTGINDNAVRSVTGGFSDSSYDTNVYIYYIVLELSRTSSTQSIRAYSVDIY